MIFVVVINSWDSRLFVKITIEMFVYLKFNL